MPINNSFVFTEVVIHWDTFEKATQGKYKVVSVKPYNDKKGNLHEGYILTLKVLFDNFDYGVDKKGVPRENNVDNNFDVTVLNRDHEVKKGDIIRLIGFDSEHSFAIGYDLLLRFKDYEVIKPQGGTTNDKK